MSVLAFQPVTMSLYVYVYISGVGVFLSLCGLKLEEFALNRWKWE